MILLVFAHYPEAQYFIEMMNFNKVKDNLFKNNDHYLLITKEGLDQALFATTQVLEYLKNINELPAQVINMGVAGALRGDIKTGEIYNIRTSYAHNGSRANFHSFTSQAPGQIDCLSSSNRALSADDKKQLLPFAQIVDRELWAIAFSCKNYQINFQSFKIISDAIEESDFCQTVSDSALFYSQKLYEHYINLDKPEAEAEKIDEIALPEFLHVTFSQKHKIHQLINLLAKQYARDPREVLEMIDLERIKLSSTLAKARTQNLIEVLTNLSNPLLSKIKKQMNIELNVLDKKYFEYNIDNLLEASSVDLKIKVSNPMDVEKINKQLAALNIAKISSLTRGEI